MTKLLLALLPFLAAPGRAQGAEDEAALLQTMVEADDGDCECLNWTEVYSGRARCGDGLEREDEGLNIYCSSPPGGGKAFYQTASHFYCMKAMPATVEGEATKKSKTKGSWCYVSAACRHLNRGKKVNKNVSYKMCKEGAGETLGELAPNDLFELAFRAGMDIQQLVVMAYDWAGPSDSATEGSIQDGDHDVSTGKARVGKSKQPDFFTVIYRTQVWEVSDMPMCMKGCGSSAENSTGSSAESA